jgi:hypothetical protein
MICDRHCQHETAMLELFGILQAPAALIPDSANTIPEDPAGTIGTPGMTGIILSPGLTMKVRDASPIDDQSSPSASEL